MMIKHMKNEKGFTLIELIIVIAILAIIAAIAIPNITASIRDSRQSADIASGKIIAEAAGRVLAMEGKYSGFEESGLNINTLTDSYIEDADYADDFQADLFEALNADIPDPKLNVDGIDETNYILVVSEGRFISVYIGDGTDISSGNALIIYPDPASEYTD